LREYETVFVLHPNYEEKEFEAEIQMVSDMITTSGGSIIEVDRWGRRRLAYDIKKVHEGIYTLLRYNSEPGVLKDIERRFRMNERMLRYMTVISEGPLAPPRAEGGSDGPGNGERRPNLPALETPVVPETPAAVETPVVPETPAAVETPVVPETPAAVEAPVTPFPVADDTPAEPADGASL
jgi:small subunit ribosomal protein S6